MAVYIPEVKKQNILGNKIYTWNTDEVGNHATGTMYGQSSLKGYTISVPNTNQSKFGKSMTSRYKKEKGLITYYYVFAGAARMETDDKTVIGELNEAAIWINGRLEIDKYTKSISYRKYDEKGNSIKNSAQEFVDLEWVKSTEVKVVRKNKKLDPGFKLSNLSNLPEGTLHFTIKEAKDVIKAVDGKSDPYAVLAYGVKKLKTTVENNNQNPKWNFKGDLVVNAYSPKVITLEVLDSKTFGKDESLGRTNLDVMDIIENHPINDKWVSLEGVKSGQVKLSADFTPLDPLDLSGSRRSSRQGDQSKRPSKQATAKKKPHPDNYTEFERFKGTQSRKLTTRKSSKVGYGAASSTVKFKGSDAESLLKNFISNSEPLEGNGSSGRTITVTKNTKTVGSRR